MGDTPVSTNQADDSEVFGETSPLFSLSSSVDTTALGSVPASRGHADPVSQATPTEIWRRSHEAAVFFIRAVLLAKTDSCCCALVTVSDCRDQNQDVETYLVPGFRCHHFG